MSYKWRIRCTVHGWQYGWADTPITECPVESSDPLVAGMVYRVGQEVPVIGVIPKTTQISSTNYERIASISYDSEHWGELCRVKVMSSMDRGATSYDVEVYNRDDHTSVIESNFTNTGDVASSDLGHITTPPSGKVNLEINAKRNGGKGDKKVSIEYITLYTRKERS